MSRFLIVANRLPVTVAATGDGFTLKPSAGGLATAMSAFSGEHGLMWVGWPGDTSGFAPELKARLDTELPAAGMMPVHLSVEEVEGFYEGFSNGVLWPLFHYQVERVNMEAWRDWDSYVAASRQFADAAVALYREGDRIWVHDYQLMLVPAMIRERLPDACIGFFLHIPFPSLEMFRTLPWRREVIEGLLGADLIGFQTYGDQRHFASCLLRLMGLDVDINEVQTPRRVVRLGTFPIGIDTAEFAARASEPAIVAEAERIAAESAGVTLVLGVDRLDYSKGLVRRFRAVERLLEMAPEMAGRFRLVQIAVPTRTNVESYAQFRRQLEELVGRINGRFSTTNWAPIQYLYRSISNDELIALYRAAGVMAVTPLRDGMNLVAKEYVACRTNGDGVLVLSEFAGAAWELGEAVQVNPYNVHQTALDLRDAILMTAEEQKLRMAPLLRRVEEWDVHAWSAGFLEALEATVAGRADSPGDLQPPTDDEIAALRNAPLVSLLLDYDGTLVPFAPKPEFASPDPELLDLLARLSSDPRIRMHIVSGRNRETLENWLGHLPVSLHAEHGFRTRPAGGEWRSNSPVTDDWKQRIRPVLEDFAGRTFGTFVEEKEAALCWHYRRADPELGRSQSRELSLHLNALLTNLPVEVLRGNRIVEVRHQGIHKGLVVPPAVAECAGVPGARLAAFGDDRTDEDLFEALPDDALSVKVGRGATAARRRVRDPGAVRAILKAIVGNPEA